MTDRDAIEFLQWALPRLGYRWAGFRKVRRQVARRVERRRRELGLATLAAYRARLERDPSEWRRLDRCCRVTISRFYRDRAVWDSLGSSVLPELARRRTGRPLAALSLGCCGGEEPYTLALVWAFAVALDRPIPEPKVLAADTDPALIARARRAVYRHSSVRGLPVGWLERGFDEVGDGYRLRDPYRAPVSFLLHDLRDGIPGRGLDLVLCRNLAFTYFATEEQLRALDGGVDALAPGGALVIGSHERLPRSDGALQPWDGCPCVFRRS